MVDALAPLLIVAVATITIASSRMRIAYTLIGRDKVPKCGSMQSLFR